MKIIERRTIDVSGLMAVCIAHEWFTHADCTRYDEFLTKWSSKKNLTTVDLYNMAQEVMMWSDCDEEVEDVMFSLAFKCITTFTAQ